MNYNAPLVRIIGARCNDEVLNLATPYYEGNTPLQFATRQLVRGELGSIEVFRAIIALSRADGSGLCVSQAPWVRLNGSLTRYATPRDACNSQVFGFRYQSLTSAVQKEIEAALTEADAACARVLVYAKGLIQTLRNALEPSPLSLLHGVLQIVESYVITPPVVFLSNH